MAACGSHPQAQTDKITEPKMLMGLESDRTIAGPRNGLRCFPKQAVLRPTASLEGMPVESKGIQDAAQPE